MVYLKVLVILFNMAKKDNKTWIVLLLIGGVLIYGMSQGWFNNIFTFNIGGAGNGVAPITPLPGNVPPQLLSYENFLSFNPNPACVGDSVTGTINTNIPNGACTLFYMGEGWTPYETFNLNSNGDVSASQVIRVAGTVQFQAVCCDAQRNCKGSNNVALTVTDCAVPPLPTTCDGYCKLTGYTTGYNAIPPTPTGCEIYPGSVFVVSPVGACCCQTPASDAPASGGDYGGQSSCSAFMGLEGKEFYSENSGITSVAGCEAYAQSYCSQFGWWVTRLDFATPDCCVWDCSGSWN
jgi:hypothetical protein